MTGSKLEAGEWKQGLNASTKTLMLSFAYADGAKVPQTLIPQPSTLTPHPSFVEKYPTFPFPPRSLPPDFFEVRAIDVERAKAVFYKYDKDNSDSLNAEELSSALADAGYMPKNPSAVFESLDLDKNGRISLPGKHRCLGSRISDECLGLRV